MNGASAWSALLDAMPWIDRLGLSLLHFLWQGVAVGAAYYVVRAVLPAARSELRYALGLAALAVLLACPVVTFLVLSSTPEAMPLGDGAAMAVTAIGHALPEDVSRWQAGLPYLVLVWCAGVLFMAWRALRDWRGLERVAHHLAERNLELERTLARLARRIGVAQRVRVLVSRHIDTPSLIGWLRPVILLPAAVAIGMPRHQLELILSHELGHLRRQDHLVNLAQALVETLLFYHPVVHWISADVRHQREICCDRLVLRASNDEPREYARALAALEELRHLPAQLAVAANGGMLVDRVRRIVGMPVPRMAASHSAGGLWLLAAAGLAALALNLQLRHAEPLPASAPALDSVASALPGALGLAGLALRVPDLEPASPAPTVAEPSQSRSVASGQAAIDASAPAAKDSPATAAGPVRDTLPLPPPARKLAASLDRSLAIAAAPLEPADLVAAARVAAPELAPIDPTSAGADAASASASASAGAAPRGEPVAIRKVAPQYPAGGLRSGNVRVEIAFGIDANGRVRDLRVLDGRSDRAFALAATDALRAWRFDPASVSADRNVRYRQTFVFAGERAAAGEADPDGCTTRTGSRICQ